MSMTKKQILASGWVCDLADDDTYTGLNGCWVALTSPVPPAFVLPTSWCQYGRLAQRQPAQDPLLRQSLTAGIAALETATGLTFGATRRPLLVSVRSGGAVSMPE